jgi:predicted ABC-type transport system involved in lysophospholipase L1 biosynthesis ATPase subunit
MMLAFDEIRIAVARVDSLASAAEAMFDDTTFDGNLDRQRIERLAHLIGATAEAAAAAIVVVDRLNADALNTAIPPSTKLDDWEGPR